MKKLFALLLALVLLLSACGGKSESAQSAASFTGSMEEAAAKLYENHTAIDLSVETHTVDLTDTNMTEYNLGLMNTDKLKEAVLSEPMMGQPYSLILARVKNAADAEAVAEEMRNNIDPRKWVCMEADTQVAAYAGDVVLFFMVSSEFDSIVTPDSILTAFQQVCGEATVLD